MSKSYMYELGCQCSLQKIVMVFYIDLCTVDFTYIQDSFSPDQLLHGRKARLLWLIDISNFKINAH